MMLAPLLLLQVFTETIAPKTDGACVAVVYKNTVHLAKRVTRSRFTGRVTLTMAGQRDHLPPSESELSTCATGCLREVAPRNSCVKACGTDLNCARACSVPAPKPKPSPASGLPPGFAPVRVYPDELLPDIFPMPVCESSCRERLPVKLGPERPGREVEIPKADLISNPSSCVCQGAGCIDK